MTQIRKYAFQTEFAPNGAIVSDGPARFSQEDMDGACAKAYERGKQDAIAHAERQAAAAVQALADTAAAVLKRLDDESRAMRAEAALVALAAARKIAGAALDAHGAERCAAAIEAAMDALRHQPRLLVKLSAATAEHVRPRIQDMCERHAYAGAVLVRADTAMGAGEIAIDWSDGVLSLNPADIEARVQALAHAALEGAQAVREEKT